MSALPEYTKQIGHDLGCYIAWRAATEDRSFDSIGEIDTYAAHLGGRVMLEGRRVLTQFFRNLEGRVRYPGS
jgi:hypothetical protein